MQMRLISDGSGFSGSATTRFAHGKDTTSKDTSGLVEDAGEEESRGKGNRTAAGGRAKALTPLRIPAI